MLTASLSFVYYTISHASFTNSALLLSMCQLPSTPISGQNNIVVPELPERVECLDCLPATKCFTAKSTAPPRGHECTLYLKKNSEGVNVIWITRDS